MWLTLKNEIDVTKGDKEIMPVSCTKDNFYSEDGGHFILVKRINF